MSRPLIRFQTLNSGRMRLPGEQMQAALLLLHLKLLLHQDGVAPLSRAQRQRQHRRQARQRVTQAVDSP